MTKTEFVSYFLTGLGGVVIGWITMLAFVSAGMRNLNDQGRRRRR